MIPIVPANTRPLFSTGFLPNMRHALSNWLRPITAQKLTKTVTNFEVVETGTVLDFNGCIIPAAPEKLVMKPAEQRSWRWDDLFTTSDLELKTDDRVIIDTIRYRVMKKWDYAQAGYYHYELCEDYVA